MKAKERMRDGKKEKKGIKLPFIGTVSLFYTFALYVNWHRIFICFSIIKPYFVSIRSPTGI